MRVPMERQASRRKPNPIRCPRNNYVAAGDYRAAKRSMHSRVLVITSSPQIAPPASRMHAWCFRSPRSNPMVSVVRFIG